MEFSNESSPLQEFKHNSYSSCSSSDNEDGITSSNKKTRQKMTNLKYSAATNFKKKCYSVLAFTIITTLLIVVLMLFTVPKIRQQQQQQQPLVQQQQQHTDAMKPAEYDISIAFIGNSMFYFNDFPRFFQIVTSPVNKIYQNSCLHGGGSIPSLLMEGNAMFPQFGTPEAKLDNIPIDATYEEIIIQSQQEELQQQQTQQESTTTLYSMLNDAFHGTFHFKKNNSHPIYDYGACTVEQLLTGTDTRLEDPGYAVPEEKNSTNLNPCREDPYYLDYAKNYFEQLVIEQEIATIIPDNNTNNSSSKFHWDYVFINDNTRNPARSHTRSRSLQFLEQFYVPLLLQTGATPIFLWTHAYAVESTEQRSMKGLEDVANFTSLTHVGYKAYSDLLSLYLPNQQKPRIAPVGLAFLLVYEERPDLWPLLFHSDHIHASPSGTFLQACICHYTLLNVMPHKDWMVRKTQHDIQNLWNTARMMQHAWEPPNPIPTHDIADYLYDVAKRIMVDGVVPQSYIPYQNGEVAYEE